MPGQTLGPNFVTPFGRNVFLRSTQDIKVFSRTAAASVITSQTIDGWANQKLLPTGMVMAKITSGGDAGKVGPFQGVSGSGVQVLTITGSPTGGGFTITVAYTDPSGVSHSGTTASIDHAATAATVQAALEAIDQVITPGGEDVVVTGSAGGPWTLTWQAGGRFANFDPTITLANSFTGGSSPAIAASVGTAPGTVTGASDGRGDVRNIVGINNTFLPWQMEFRDVEIGVVVEAWVVQSWCLMYDHSGAPVVLSDEVAQAMASSKSLNLRFV